MKKLLLTLLSVVATIGAVAQVQQADNTQLSKATRLQHNTQYITAPLTQSTPQTRAAKRKSAETGLYYQLEEGSLYVGVSDEGMSHYNSTVAVPPFVATTFYNRSVNPLDTKWYMAGFDYTEYEDENGDIATIIYPATSIDSSTGETVNFAYYYPFELWNATMTDHYVFGIYSETYDSYLSCYRETEWLSFVDDKDGYGGGQLDNGNIMGTGTYTDWSGSFGDGPGTVYKSLAVVQDYPAPRSSMYVEKVTIPGCTSGVTTFSNGAELTLNIYKASNDELIESLTASEEDVCYYDAGYREVNSTMQYVQFVTVTFKKMIYDPLFGLMESPFTIPAEPFYVEIDGFDNEDVNFGVSLFQSSECDQGLTPAYDCIQNVNGQSDPFYIHYEPNEEHPYHMMLEASFKSMMDYVEVASEIVSTTDMTFSNMNIIKMSDDGTECHTYGVQQGGMYDIGWVYVNTACPWYDEDGNENYYIADSDDLDWILGYYVDDTDYDDDEYYFWNYLYFQTEALPAGVTGRAAAFRIQGRGAESETVVYILQGDATPADANGIQQVNNAQQLNAKSGTYNLAGQRVTDTTRGLIIKDGKKIINK